MDKEAVKDELFWIPAENSLSFCAPLDQYDADNEEGDGSGEEIGSRYAVRHRLRPFRVADGPTRSGADAGPGICARLDDGIGVVAIKQ